MKMHEYSEWSEFFIYKNDEKLFKDKSDFSWRKLGRVLESHGIEIKVELFGSDSGEIYLLGCGLFGEKERRYLWFTRIVEETTPFGKSGL